MRRTLRTAVLGAFLGALAVAGMVGSAFSAPATEAQAVNHAAVIVDGYAPRCISFSSESVSGTQALQLAGFSTAIRSYSGEGGAVCAINGVGCAADANCLTCSAPNYWAYFRADNGAGGFSYSGVGGGSAQVTDGDVEGWRFGTGAAPAYASVASVCPLEPPTTTTTTTTPPHQGGGGGNGNGGHNGGPNTNGGPAGGSNGGAGPAGGSGDGGPADDPAGGPATTVAPTTTVVADGTNRGDVPSSSADDGGAEVDGEEAASITPLDDSGGGGGSTTWVAFAVLLAGFGVAGWRIRRLRGRTG